MYKFKKISLQILTTIIAVGTILSFTSCSSNKKKHYLIGDDYKSNIGSWEHNNALFSDAQDKLARQIYYVETKINGLNQQSANDKVLNNLGIFNSLVKNNENWDDQSVDDPQLAHQHLKTIMKQANLTLWDKFAFNDIGRDDMINNYTTDLTNSSIPSKDHAKYTNTITTALSQTSNFYKLSTANYFDDIAVSLSFPNYLKGMTGQNPFSTLSIDSIMQANCATVLKYAESEFQRNLSLNDDTNSFIAKLAGCSSTSTYNVGDQIAISDYGSFLSFNYDKTIGAMLSANAPVGIDYKNATSNQTTFTSEVKVNQPFGTSYSNVDTNYAAGDIYPGYKLQLQIDNIDITSDSQYVNLSLIPGVIPTNSTLNNTIWETNHDNYFNVKLKITYNTNGYEIYKYIANQNYQNNTTNNIAASPDGDDCYFTASSSSRPYLKNVLNRYNGDKNQASWDLSENLDFINSGKPVKLLQEETSMFGITSINDKNIYTSNFKNQSIIPTAVSYNANASGNHWSSLEVKLGVWDDSISRIVKFIPWTINGASLNSIYVRFNQDPSDIAKIRYATQVIEVVDDFSTAFEYIKNIYTNKQEDKIAELGKIVDLKNKLFIAEGLVEVAAVSLEIVYTALSIATFGVETWELVLTTAVVLATTASLAVETYVNLTINENYNNAKAITDCTKTFIPIWQKVSDTVKANRNNILDSTINPNAKVASSEAVIIALNNDLTSPNCSPTIDFFKTLIQQLNGSLSSSDLNKINTGLTFDSTNENPQLSATLGTMLTTWFSAGGYAIYKQLDCLYNGASEDKCSDFANFVEKYHVTQIANDINFLINTIKSIYTIIHTIHVVKGLQLTTRAAMLAGSPAVPIVLIALDAISVIIDIVSNYIVD